MDTSLGIEVSKDYAMQLMEGTRYIGMIYKYYGILPNEFDKDYKFYITDNGLELKWVVSEEGYTVMTFKEIDARPENGRFVRFVLGLSRMFPTTPLQNSHKSKNE